MMIRVRILSVVMILLLVAGVGNAQNTDIEALSGLQFDFGNPGARALGMGGAFIGLADDASATEANPAGLTILRQPEFTLELRSTRTSQRFGTGGWYPDVLESDFPSESTEPAFVSIVYPLGRFATAFYYHSSMNLQNDVDIVTRFPTPSYFLGPSGPLTRQECLSRNDCVEHQIYPFRTKADLELETVGGSLAFEAGRFSIGTSFRYHQFREDASTIRTDLDAPGSPTFLVAQRNGASIFGSESDDDFSFIVGAKWRPSDRFSFGAVFKKGPAFPAPLFAALVSGSEAPNLEIVRVVDFNIPDVAGIGMSFRPVQSLTINLDVLSVDYSSLTDDFGSIIEIEFIDGEIVDIESLHGFTTSDVIEIHLGVEYFFQTNVPFGVRLGTWRDPAHSIEYRGPLTVTHEVAASILFPQRDDEMHYSAGFGFAWPRWQLDAAYDYADSLETGSLSLVLHF